MLLKRKFSGSYQFKFITHVTKPRTKKDINLNRGAALIKGETKK